MYSQDKIIEVAKVLKPHGLHGEIKLEPYTFDNLFWKRVKTLTISNTLYSVKSTRLYKDFVYVLLEEVSTCEQADLLRNMQVFANKAELSVSRDEYLISDLEACVVVDEKDNILGYVDSVEKYGSADIINILIGGGLHSFPFLERVIKDVDVAQKKIVVYKDKFDEVLV